MLHFDSSVIISPDLPEEKLRRYRPLCWRGRRLSISEEALALVATLTHPAIHCAIAGNQASQ